MIHQPWGGAQGTAADIKIHAEEILSLKKRLNQIISKHTGQSIEKVERDSDRDKFMSADEAKKYGLVDEVVDSLKTIEQKKGESKPGSSDLAPPEDR